MSDSTAKLSSFEHAAVCLAEAAASLSVAAQAMAIAADAFCAIIPQCHQTDLIPADISGEPNYNHKRGPSEAGVVQLGLEGISEAGIEAVQQLPANNDEDEDEGDHTSMSDNDYYMSDQDEDYVYALLQRQQEEISRQNNSANLEARAPETITHSQIQNPTPVPALPSDSTLALDTSSPYFRKRILVQSEADILAAVCAVSQRFNKVFCYMQYPLCSLTLFQKIIKDVTRAFVCAMTPRSPDRLLSMFDGQNKAIMLLHETFSSSLSPQSTDSFCIIHVGWPRDVARYKAQTTFQNTSNSILVACLDDQTIYPACEEVLRFTTPWVDQGGVSLKNVAATLNSRLQNSLVSVAQSVKEKAYTDWIDSHSRGGARYVSSWTPSVLIEHANAYILETLRYKPENSNSVANITSSQHLPLVSPEFVKQHGLEQAVQEGLLAVATIDSGLNQASDLPRRSPENKDAEGSSNKNSAGTTAGPVATSTSQPQKYSYVVQDEFDVLPVACALAGLYDKVILYVTSSHSSFALIKRLLTGATTMDVVTLSAVTPADITRASNEFKPKTRAVLVLSEDMALENTTFLTQSLCVIHVGWPSNYTSYLSQTTRFVANSTILVACMQDVDIFPAGLAILGQAISYPNRTAFEAHSLPLVRAMVESILAKETTRVKEQLYKDWIEEHGIHGPRRVVSWTPIKLALRANDYLLNVLRYHPTTSGLTTSQNALPSLWAGFVEHNGLQQAVEVGILKVVTPQKADPRPSVAPASIGSPAPSSSTPVLDIKKPGEVPVSTEKNPPPKPSQSISKEYMVHGNEFDIIPSICRLSKQTGQKSTICFVKEVCVFQALSSMISEITDKPVFVVLSSAPKLLATVTQAIASPKGCIVFCSSVVQLVEQLRGEHFTQSIHAVCVDNISLYQDQIAIPTISRSCIMFTLSDLVSNSHATLDRLKAAGIRECAQYELRLGDCGNKWKLQLISAPSKTLRRAYMEWIICYFSGPQKVAHWTAVDVVNRANSFAKDVLLRAVGYNGSIGGGLVGGPLSVTPGFVKQWKLESAVAAKVLRVE